MSFTVEEVNMMCIFRKADSNSPDEKSHREELIKELEALVPKLLNEPAELSDIAKSCIYKLFKMSDAEFNALDFYPEYEEMEEN
jgi:hypothetical protein